MIKVLFGDKARTYRFIEHELDTLKNVKKKDDEYIEKLESNNDAQYKIILNFTNENENLKREIGQLKADILRMEEVVKIMARLTTA